MTEKNELDFDLELAVAKYRPKLSMHKIKEAFEEQLETINGELIRSAIERGETANAANWRKQR